jgi:hypothetical protein
VTTLIHVRFGNGQSYRCDARCYDAKQPGCECICGGKNHGVGMAKAVENVCAYTKAELEAITEKGGWIPDEIKQGKLL